MRHKILVVDDEEQVRNTVRFQLSGTDFEVLEAADGEAGIELLNTSDNRLAVERIKQGVSDYIVKPVEKEKLIAAIEKAISERSLFS